MLRPYGIYRNWCVNSDKLQHYSEHKQRETHIWFIAASHSECPLASATACLTISMDITLVWTNFFTQSPQNIPHVGIWPNTKKSTSPVHTDTSKLKNTTVQSTPNVKMVFGTIAKEKTE